MKNTIVLKDAEQPITLNLKGTKDIFIIKYKKVQEGKYTVEWTDVIETGGAPFMTALIETSDGGILFGGAVQGYVKLPDGTSLTNSKTIDNTLLVKYTKKENGEPGYDFSWARRVTGDNNKITGITETTEGKYVLAGYLGGTISIPGIVGPLSTKGGLDNLVMVFNENGDTLANGLKQIGGIGNELLNHVAKMNDGGYVTVGSISSDVTLENGQKIKHNESGKAATDASQRDAIVTRYDKNMNTLCARTYGGVGQDHFTSVFIDEDNNILLGTYYRSDGIRLENKEVSGGYLDGFNDNNVDAAMIQLKEYVETPQTITMQYVEIPGEAIPMIDVEVEKKWDNYGNKYAKPESVTIELISKIKGELDEKIEATIIMTKENKVVIEGEPDNYETWRYVFTKLPQCTKYGKEIEYKINEKEHTLDKKK